MQLSFADLFRISWNYQQHLLETNIYVGNRLRKNYEPIITEKRGVKIHDYNTNTVDLFYYMYLKDVRYQVRAHMIPNVNHPEFANDWNENKHHNIAKRSVKSGSRRNPFLGTSECFAFVDECVFGEGESYYDNLPGQIEYGNMFHSFTFPDQAIREDEKGKLIVNFWNPVLQPGGIVKFIRPEECKSKKSFVICL